MNDVWSELKVGDIVEIVGTPLAFKLCESEFYVQSTLGKVKKFYGKHFKYVGSDDPFRRTFKDEAFGYELLEDKTHVKLVRQ